jgi:hypothetical protein
MPPPAARSFWTDGPDCRNRKRGVAVPIAHVNIRSFGKELANQIAKLELTTSSWPDFEKGTQSSVAIHINPGNQFSLLDFIDPNHWRACFLDREY